MALRGARSISPHPHVLIVDDDRDTRDMCVAGLSILGSTVTAADGVAHACDGARRRSPDSNAPAPS